MASGACWAVVGVGIASAACCAAVAVAVAAVVSAGAGVAVGADTTSTLLPGHTEPLNTWRALAGTLASEGIILADVAEPLTLRNCHAVPWQTGLDMV